METHLRRCFADTESCDVLLRQDPWENTWWETISRTQQKMTVCLHSSLCNNLTSLKESHQLPLASQLVLVATAGSSRLGGGLAVSPGLCHCCWFMFDILTLLNWTASILTNRDWNHPQRTTSKQVYRPLSYLPSILSYLWTRRGAKYLRTLIKSRF